jgi:hypothetical protein
MKATFLVVATLVLVACGGKNDIETADTALTAAPATAERGQFGAGTFGTARFGQ